MALCHNCDTTRIEYTGDGSQTDFTFPFEYNDPADVSVAFFGEDKRLWIRQNNGIWSFKNDTTIRFDEAPEAGQKLIIYRCTDLEPLPAEFFPGNSIKAQDLNDNFFVLQSAIEEARCEAQRLDENNQDRYWNKISWRDADDPDKINGNGETIYGDDKWVCADDKIATTKAVCNHVEERLDNLTVSKKEQRKGLWVHDESNLDSDDYLATTAAISERSDPYFQSNLPNQPPYQIPGKPWFDETEIRYRVWDQNNKVWIDASKAGRRGARGPIGPHKTIVSPTAPKRRDDNSPLENGDFWFDSSSAQIYVYYDDGNPEGTKGTQWVQAVSVGLEGPQGPPGGSIQISINKPSNPSSGDLWWSSSDIEEGGGRLFVNTGTEWVDVSQPGTSGAKGEKGDAFEYSDFTQDQLDSFVGPPGAPSTVPGPPGAPSTVPGPPGAPGTPGKDGTNPNNGLLSIKDSDGKSLGTFSANQATATNVVIPAGGGDIPVGTRMIFAQALPPVGWSIDHSFQGHAIKIRSGDPNVTWVQSGGSVGFGNCFKNRSIAVNGATKNATAPSGGTTTSKSGSISASGNSLSTAQLASHYHTCNGQLNAVAGFASGPNWNLKGQNTATSGSNSTHGHAGSFESHNHTLATSTTPHAHDINFSTSLDLDVLYLNCCVGTKN